MDLKKVAPRTIEVAMRDQNVTRAELARRIGRSRAFVTQVLSGQRNMTLDTFALLLDALDYQVAFRARPANRTYSWIRMKP